MRPSDVVRAEFDGRRGFGIVHEGVLPDEAKRKRIGSIGYAVFTANGIGKGCLSAMERFAGRSTPTYSKVECLCGAGSSGSARQRSVPTWWRVLRPSPFYP